MSQRIRTPRQRQGDDLLVLVTRVPPDLYAKVAEAAAAEERAKADIVRRALVEYFDGPEGE